MKKRKMIRAALTLLLTLALPWAFSAAAKASEGQIEAQAEAAGVYELESTLEGEAAELLDGASASNTNVDEGFRALLRSIRVILPDILRAAVKGGAIVLMIAALCGVAESVLESAGSSFSSSASLAAVAAVSMAVLGTSRGFLGLGAETLAQIDGFSKVLLPTLSGIAASAGAVTSAATKYAATALFMNVLITLSESVILPVIYAYAASVIAEAAFSGEAVAAASSFLKWLAAGLMTLLVLCFVVYLGMTGVISGVADASAVRLAKTTISTTLPVVGGIMSDAAASILTGTSILRGTVGVFGMLGVAALCVIPFLKLGAHFIVYKAVSKIAAGFCGKRLGGLLSGLANVFGLIMGLAGSCAMMLYFSLISLIKVVTY